MKWPMRDVFLLTLVAGVGMGCGCRSTDWQAVTPWAGPSPHESTTNPPGDAPMHGRHESDRSAPASSTSPSPGGQIVDLSFDVARAQMQVRGERHSEKVWNHVDALRVDPATASNLARNGLRVGAAAPEAWPAIQAILQAANAEVSRDQLIAPRGRPLALDLGTLEAGTSTFTYLPSGRLVGKTFLAGNRIVTIDYLYRLEQGGLTDIHLSFEIRHDHGVMTWERRGGVIRQVPSIDRHVFEGLEASVSLADGEFLILGVDGDSASDYLIGRRLLTDSRAGESLETLLFLTPKVMESTPIPRRASR